MIEVIKDILVGTYEIIKFAIPLFIVIGIFVLLAIYIDPLFPIIIMLAIMFLLMTYAVGYSKRNSKK